MSDELTRLENESIRAFVQRAADDGYLSGRVLDYGSGRQPYRNVVEKAGGEYVPYDSPSFPASIAAKDTTGDAWQHDFDTVLCNQVVQFIEDVGRFLFDIRMRFRKPEIMGAPKPTCHLVLTYTTNWPEVNAEDLHRFTRTGMQRLLADAGFEIIRHEPRESFDALGYEWAFGYGVIARA